MLVFFFFWGGGGRVAFLISSVCFAFCLVCFVSFILFLFLFFCCRCCCEVVFCFGVCFFLGGGGGGRWRVASSWLVWVCVCVWGGGVLFRFVLICLN